MVPSAFSLAVTFPALPSVRDVTKNVEDVFRVNDVILDEVTTYVLYLWLVDADGVNKSAIYPLTFTTDDETPPEFNVDPTAVCTGDLGHIGVACAESRGRVVRGREGDDLGGAALIPGVYQDGGQIVGAAGGQAGDLGGGLLIALGYLQRITRLEVNAPGCVVEMLPDEIVIRPGITAIINGEEMDSVAAEESSKEPMIAGPGPRGYCPQYRRWYARWYCRSR